MHKEHMSFIDHTFTSACDGIATQKYKAASIA